MIELFITSIGFGSTMKVKCRYRIKTNSCQFKHWNCVRKSQTVLKKVTEKSKMKSKEYEKIEIGYDRQWLSK